MEKPKKVKEYLIEKFSEDSDPIKDMDIGKIGMFKALEKRVRMRFNFGEKAGIEKKKKVIENIYKITEIVDKLVEAGCKEEDMAIYNYDEIEVKGYQVLKGNWVLFSCLTEEDAETLIQFIKMFSIWNYDSFKISRNSIGQSVKTGEYGNEWLDNLLENREKIKKLNV